MSISDKLTKIGLYLVSTHENTIKTTSENYMVVGGLAVQIHAAEQFKEYHRPTIDADILVETIPFKEFRATYGNQIASKIKHSFGLGYHVRNGHNANMIQLIDDQSLSQKDVFLLTFTRHQDELYRKIKNKVISKLETDIVEVKLESIGITAETIETKAKINIKPGEYINVESVPELINAKFGRILSKQRTYDVEINNHLEQIRRTIIRNGTSSKVGQHIDLLNELILTSYTTNKEQYNIEKDIFDFCLLKKIEGN